MQIDVNFAQENCPFQASNGEMAMAYFQASEQTSFINFAGEPPSYESMSLPGDGYERDSERTYSLRISGKTV
jgi:hypothetical protein